MADKIISEEIYIINGKYVSYSYKDGELTDISIQERDGEVLFTGSPKEAHELWDTLDTVVNS